MQKLRKDLVERDAEIITLKETIQSRLAQLDSDSGHKSCVEQLIDENRRLIADKTKLLQTLSEEKRINSAEERELREMVGTTSLSYYQCMPIHNIN